MFESIKPKNKNAFLFTISNAYVYLLANVLLQLKQNSPKAYNQADIIVQIENATKESKKILSSLHDSVFFIDISLNDFQDPEFIKKIFNNYKWHYTVFHKLNVFTLLKQFDYESIVYLDVDIFIQKEIFCLFEQKYPIAIRPMLSTWRLKLSDLKVDNPNLFKNKDINKEISFNGGVIVFNKSINKYNLNINQILEEDLPIITDKSNNYKLQVRGGPDELLLCYNILYHDIPYFFLDIEFNRFPTISTKNTYIVHFGVGFDNRNGKPWLDTNVLYAFPSWNTNNDYIYDKFHIGPGKFILDSGNVYCKLFFNEIFLEILPKLDLYTRKLNFNYTNNQNQNFFIPNISSKIKYGIYVKNRNNICIYLLINDKIFIHSPYFQKEFNNILNKFEEIFGDIAIKLQNSDFIKYEITTQEIEQTAFIFNSLVSITYDNIINIFKKQNNILE